MAKMRIVQTAGDKFALNYEGCKMARWLYTS